MPRAKYYQRTDGLYETIRKINGKRVAFRGKTCAEVDRKMIAYQEEAAKGRFVPDLVEAWEREKEAMVAAGTIATSTLQTYNAGIKRIKAYFSGIRSGDVTPRDLMRYIRDMEGKGYAGQSVSTELSILKQVFSYAVLMGDIAVSPATEVQKSRRLPKGERRPLTEEEEKKVDQYRGPDWEMGMLLLYTGCRRGELLALTWQDIDRAAGVVHINKKLQMQFVPPVLDGHLKNRESRNTPLFDRLASVLPRDRIGLIFTDEHGNYLTRNTFLKRWTAYRQAVGLGDDVTPHCFRHSYATLCYESGIDSKACAAFLGDTEEVTRKVYQALRDRHHKTSAAVVNAFIADRFGSDEPQAQA